MLIRKRDYYQRVHAVLPLLCELYVDKSSQVLDIGCGNGEFSAVIARYCGSLEGFDLSHSLVAHAKSLDAPNATFTAKGVDELRSFPDKAFDAIFVMGVFATLHGHLFEDTVVELERLLKPGGVVITRDSLVRGDELVRRVTGDYYARYRNLNHPGFQF